MEGDAQQDFKDLAERYGKRIEDIPGVASVSFTKGGELDITTELLTEKVRKMTWNRVIQIIGEGAPVLIRIDGEDCDKKYANEDTKTNSD